MFFPRIADCLYRAQMIAVTDPDRPFALTAKGTPRRQICIDAYAPAIDALYARVEESAQVDVAPPTEWSEGSAREYVGSVVRAVLRAKTVEDEDDLFQQGADRFAFSP